MKRDRSKLKNKTNPSGVRFDIVKFDFIKDREGLKTGQQVVNFLMDEYYYRLKGGYVKDVPVTNGYDYSNNSIRAVVKNISLKPVEGVFRAKNLGEGSIDYQLAKAEWEVNHGLLDLL